MLYVYRINNIREAEAIYRYLDKIDWGFHTKDVKQSLKDFPICIFNTEERYLGGNSEEFHKTWLGINKATSITFQEIFDGRLEKKEYIEVKLNEILTAKVYKDKIVVGCQTFLQPQRIIGELQEAYNIVC